MALLDDLKAEVSSLVHHTAITPTLINGFISALDALLYSQRYSLFDSEVSTFVLSAAELSKIISPNVSALADVISLEVNSPSICVEYLNVSDFYKSENYYSGVNYFTFIKNGDDFLVNFNHTFATDLPFTVVHHKKLNTLDSEHIFFKENYHLYLYGVLSLAFNFLQSIGSESANSAFERYTVLHTSLVEARSLENSTRVGKSTQSRPRNLRYNIDNGA